MSNTPTCLYQQYKHVGPNIVDAMFRASGTSSANLMVISMPSRTLAIVEVEIVPILKGGSIQVGVGVHLSYHRPLFHF
jgi:hypothetical protein